MKREYERLLEEGEKDVMISSICPSVVRLVKIHYPELMDSLLSVLSPMQAHGKYLKEQNRECTLVYISPCISPIAELNEQINDVSYVISFDELDDWLAENQMCIEDEKENVEPRLSRMRALGGGMSRIMKKNPKYSYIT